MGQQILAPATPGLYDDLVQGTCELAQTYGTVISGELEEPEDRDLIRGCDGNVSAVLLKDDEVTYNFTALFADGVSLPEKGDNITFPTDFGSLVGQVMSRKLVWAREGQKLFSLKASHFKSIGNAPTVVVL